MTVNFDPTKRPECANCKKPAMLLYGRIFLCGNCAIKAQELGRVKQEAYIMEGLKNGEK